MPACHGGCFRPPPGIVFYIATGGPNSCGHGCNQWIAADGTFDEGAPQRLRQVLRKLAGRKLPVFFHSPGGNGAAALEAGRLLRKEKLTASVGRTAPDGCDRDKLYDDACRALKHDGVTAALDDTVTMCNSACVYVLAGAFERLVPPGAHLGIHSARVKPHTPVSAAAVAVARTQFDQRIDAYLREMGVDRTLLTEANAIPFQSVRFLRRDEIVRFGIDRREFGETGWHFMDKPRPTISKAYFMRSGNKEFPYRTGFLSMDCGTPKLAALTVAIEMAGDETGAGGQFVITVNGARVDSGWGREYLVREPARFDVRTTSLTAEMVAGMDDGGAIEVFTPDPAIGAQSTVRLAMNGFSGAYAALRKACDAAPPPAFPWAGVTAGCLGGGTPPYCLILAPSGQTTTSSLRNNRDGFYDRAMAVFDQAIQLDPKSASAYANRGSAYNLKGDYDRALADYEEAIRLAPNNAASHRDRGQVYIRKGDYDRALVDYDQAIRLDPKNPSLYGSRGDAYLIKGDHDHAIADYDQAIQLDPKSASVHVYRGYAYNGKRDYDRAIADFAEAIRLDPRNAAAYGARGRAYYAKGDPDRAIADYDQAIQLGRNASAYNERGNAYEKKSDHDRAIADYGLAIQLDPKYAYAYLGRGISYSRQHDYERAIPDLDQAIQLDPKNANAYNSRGFVHWRRHDLDRAIADYDQAITLNPKRAEFYNNRGTVYNDKDDYDRAIADLEQAIQLNPDDANPYSHRGYAYGRKGDCARAMIDLNKALALNPKYARDFSNRAAIYELHGDLDQAVADADEAIRLDPTDALAYNWRGQAYFDEKHYDLAVIDYQQALRLDPLVSEARRNHERAQAALTTRR